MAVPISNSYSQGFVNPASSLTKARNTAPWSIGSATAKRFCRRAGMKQLASSSSSSQYAREKNWQGNTFWMRELSVISISREKGAGAVFTRPGLDEMAVERVCPSHSPRWRSAPPKCLGSLLPSSSSTRQLAISGVWRHGTGRT